MAGLFVFSLADTTDAQMRDWVPQILGERAGELEALTYAVVDRER